MSNRIDLEAFRYAAMQVMARDFVVDIGEQAFAELAHDLIMVRVERKVYGHRLAEWDVRVEVPINWWQHLKQTLGLKAKTRVHTGTVVRKRIYPDMPMVPINSGRVSFIVEDNA